MADETRLTRPWLVAVWPGMGHVALSAGYYLMAKLGMHQLAEFAAEGLFDVEHVEVKGGLIHPGRLPRSRLFVWNDPLGRHDLVVFIGEAQPPLGKYTFCRRLIEFARGLGVERVFTFAAMATQMHPASPSRVFGAATDEETLAELRRLELEVLDDGHIGGLNGVLLGAAAEAGLRGACLLGEMPHVFAQLPFPKASLAVLDAFTTVAGIADRHRRAVPAGQGHGAAARRAAGADAAGVRAGDARRGRGDRPRARRGRGARPGGRGSHRAPLRAGPAGPRMRTS